MELTASKEAELVFEVHTVDDEAAKRVAVTRRQDDHGGWLFDLDLPESGEYSLNVMARDDRNEAELYSVHTYLVQSDGRHTGMSLTKVKGWGWVGGWGGGGYNMHTYFVQSDGRHTGMSLTKVKGGGGRYNMHTYLVQSNGRHTGMSLTKVKGGGYNMHTYLVQSNGRYTGMSLTKVKGGGYNMHTYLVQSNGRHTGMSVTHLPRAV